MSVENLIKELSESYFLILKERNIALNQKMEVVGEQFSNIPESKLAVDNLSVNIRNSIEGILHRHGVLQLEQEVKELKALNQRFKDGVHHFNHSRGNMNPLLTAVVESPSRALAQHDKEVTIKAIRKFSEGVDGFQDFYVKNHVTSFSTYRDKFIEQLQEQE